MTTIAKNRGQVFLAALLVSVAVLAWVARVSSAQGPFRVEEATIADMQNAIKSGQATCQAVVQAYIDRAKAYNGTCTALVTADGAPIPEAKGRIRAGSAVTFPTTTVPVSSVFPNYRDYAGPPLESAGWKRRFRIPPCSSSTACASASRTPVS